MNSYLFTSERLGFRNWKESDTEPMISISANPVVMEFFTYVAKPQQTIDFIERMKTMFAKKGYCYFAVDELETRTFIGFIGLSDQEYDAEFTPCTDIGWRLDPKFWNKGYGTEGAKACLNYAFETVKLKRIYSVTTAIHETSINVMKKIGMKHHLNFVQPKQKGDERLENCVCYKASEL
jgi:RimJ/RimL family protein N-acetyltransferase